VGNPISFTGVTQGGLTVKELDGNPTVAQVKTIQVSNGTLTDNGGGVVTITTGGGGGGGGVTTIGFGTTGLTPATATSGVVTVAGTLALANGGTGATTASGARENLKIISGRQTETVAGSGGSISSIVVTNSNVTATNVVLYTLETAAPLELPGGSGFISARSASTSFTVKADIVNPTPDAADVIVNYTIIG